MTKNEIADMFITHIFRELYDCYVLPKNLRYQDIKQRADLSNLNKDEHNYHLIFNSTVIWLHANGFINSDAQPHLDIAKFTISDKGLAALNGRLPASLGGKGRLRDWITNTVEQASQTAVIEAGRHLVTQFSS
ncbi:hypothetical protein [Dichotomicrobium thermohalophilum]|uniref:Uncharacterized protein n=1 Tax=Dichotomicrobium thermohalophilum TaxID=933063 RepID=A0A397PFL4_9HYPH|nr:hypothetical protein [Dichotomicrobium thermohalophilum]RIA47748.1 hypothetical protein BXY53_2315 [Dichotomicrobium thermohalophilum]